MKRQSEVLKAKREFLRAGLEFARHADDDPDGTPGPTDYGITMSVAAEQYLAAINAAKKRARAATKRGGK